MICIDMQLSIEIEELDLLKVSRSSGKLRVRPHMKDAQYTNLMHRWATTRDCSYYSLFKPKKTLIYTMSWFCSMIY